MNTEASLVENNYEKEFSVFLLKRITKAGGSIQLQHITGHLSQVKPEVRDAVGKSLTEIRCFLERYRDLFIVENNSVSLVKPPTYSKSMSGYDSDSSSLSQSSLPKRINNGKGVIVKIFDNYGFIKSKDPIKTEIFFQSYCLGRENIDLTSFLFVGTIVFFHAKLESSSKQGFTKYRATKVWKAVKDDTEKNSVIPKLRKNRETGLYDPLVLSSEGTIQNIFPNLGFISVKNDDKNTVFFHKNRLANYDNIVDLTQILSKGDKVAFNAHRSTKPDARARWEATKVWKISGKIKGNISQSNSNQSSSETSLPNIAGFKTNEMKKNQQGKICPRSHGAVIKFGANEIADGDSAIYYVCGSQVTDIGWEFSEGDNVYFDAVKIKSAPGWKAVLVWNGDKPNIVLPTCLGDFSEFNEEDEEVNISKSNSYMSESCSSSLKSESTKDFVNERTQEATDFTIGAKGKISKKNKKNHITSSQDSLSSMSASKDSHLKKTEIMNDSTSNIFVGELNERDLNWCDISYSDNEVCENDEPSKNFKPTTSVKSVDNYVTEDDDMSEYASATEDEKTDEIKNNENLLQNDMKCTGSIKIYHNIKGKINKIYSKYAAVKSYSLQNVIPFFWSDFYSDGMSLEELGIDNLKQILKVGDNVSFNCFIIVDDSGINWQKVSLAWSGKKPKNSIEITPEDYIVQNKLSVTINNQLNDEEMQDDKIVHRKFLIPLVDDCLDVPVNKLSRTESCSEEELLTSSQKSPEFCTTLLPSYFKSLSHKVCEILKEDASSLESRVDLNTISEEIVTVILGSFLKKCDTQFSKALLQESIAAKSFSDICSKCMENSTTLKSVDKKDTEVQTIITGDIIAQNICPEY